MQQEGISPNRVTYLCLLKACGGIGDMNKGQEVHGSVALIGLDRDPIIGSSLVDMYVRCGSLKGARAVFDKVPDRGVIAWNALMAGYAESCGEEVLDCLENMQLNNICPDYVTYVCCLKACESIRDLAKGLAIHRTLLREGLETDIIVASMLIRMYGKLGLLSKARDVFEKLRFRDAVSYSALITGYVENEHYEEALTFFDQLLHQGVYPHRALLGSVLKACTSLRYVPRGQEIHTDIARRGLEEDILLVCTLLDFYGKCGLLATAQKVFDQVSVRDVALWNALISAYASFGCTDKALKYFGQMQHEGVYPDNVSYTCLLKACSKSELIGQNQELHADIVRKGFETELFVGSALVNVYARCGSLSEAQQSFSMLSVQDDVSWTTIIMGYALQLGNAHKTWKLFEKMIGEGIEPNVVTFIGLLNAYSHSGQVEKGRMYFESISCPAHDHYACVLDVLCRAGFMEESLMVIEKMPFHPGNLVWETMLGACRKWGRVELGRQVFDHAVLVDESNAAAYVCMANIYADAAILDL